MQLVSELGHLALSALEALDKPDNDTENPDNLVKAVHGGVDQIPAHLVSLLHIIKTDGESFPLVTCYMLFL